jgi:hypothetical protein
MGKFHNARSVGRPRTRWEDVVHRDALLLQEMGVWSRSAGDKDEWGRLLREARAQQRLQHHTWTESLTALRITSTKSRRVGGGGEPTHHLRCLIPIRRDQLRKVETRVIKSVSTKSRNPEQAVSRTSRLSYFKTHARTRTWGIPSECPRRGGQGPTRTAARGREWMRSVTLRAFIRVHDYKHGIATTVQIHVALFYCPTCFTPLCFNAPCQC